ncbi:MAG: hypothetical protein ABIG29_02230 [Candidatus Nealsonbacteria bacterium]
MWKGAIFRFKTLILYKLYHHLYWRHLNRGFVFNEKKYRYFYHPYNTTWRNERKVEIPIIRELLEQNKGKRILEVGRVLPHYFPVSHDVLDKYEKGKDVINEDVVDFTPSRNYDLIVSISTLEHVGWGEASKEPGKAVKALENLKKCLNPGGKIVFTVPIGQNPHLDNLIKNQTIRTDKLYYFNEIVIGVIQKT